MYLYTHACALTKIGGFSPIMQAAVRVEIVDDLFYLCDLLYSPNFL